MLSARPVNVFTEPRTLPPAARKTMPPNGSSPAPQPSRHEKWAAWFRAVLDRRSLQNSDVQRLLDDALARLLGDHARGKYKSDAVGAWITGKSRPSETGALWIAEALGIPHEDVLLAADYPDAAAIIKNLSSPDPLRDSIRSSGLSEQARTAAEDYVREERESIRRRTEEYVRMWRRGEQIIAEREREGHNGTRDAS